MLRITIIWILTGWMLSRGVAQVPDKHSFAEEFNRRSIIKVNILSPFLGVVNIHYEMKHNANVSSQIEFFYFTGVAFGQPTAYKGAGLTYNYRYYIRGTCPEGLYVQPFGRIQKYDYLGTQNPTIVNTPQAAQDIVVFSPGLVFGYQTFFKNRFSFELFAGPVYNFAYINGARASGRDIGSPVNGGWVRMGTTIGYAF
jgi:hypothetical protein